MRKKRVALITIIALSVIGVLRETSVLVISLYSVHLLGAYTGGYDSTRVYLDARNKQKHDENQVGFRNDFNIHYKAWRIGMYAFAEPASSADSSPSMPNLSPGTFSLTDVRLDVSGVDWLPLIKSAKWEYHVSFEGKTRSGATIEGTIDGNATLRLYGICSLKTSRDYARAQILGTVEEDLRSRVSK